MAIANNGLRGWWTPTWGRTFQRPRCQRAFGALAVTVPIVGASLIAVGCGGSQNASSPPMHLYHNPPPVPMSRKQSILCIGPGNGTALVAPTKKQDNRIYRKALAGKYQYKMPASITLHRLPNGQVVGSCHFGPPSKPGGY